MARAVSALTAVAAAAHGQAQVLGHRQLGEQRPLLGDAGQAATGGQVGPSPGHRRAVDPDLAGRGAGQGAGRGQHGRRLARPVAAEEGDHLPGADHEVDVVHHLGPAVPGRQAPDLERGGAVGRRSNGR